jgi:hypothetical protein
MWRITRGSAPSPPEPERAAEGKSFHYAVDEAGIVLTRPTGELVAVEPSTPERVLDRDLKGIYLDHIDARTVVYRVVPNYEIRVVARDGRTPVQTLPATGGVVAALDADGSHVYAAVVREGGPSAQIVRTRLPR